MELVVGFLLERLDREEPKRQDYWVEYGNTNTALDIQQEREKIIRAGTEVLRL